MLATRYVTPLREGGSLPGVMEADDLGTYVVKFRGAGQGPAALAAEVICARLAASLGLDTPRQVLVDLDPALAAAEPDEEVQQLLAASPGLNLGIDFLPGALDVGPVPNVEPGLAGRIIWFDALVNNVDRSWRNPNLLRWHTKVFLIDHGAALTFQHAWPAAGPSPQEWPSAAAMAERSARFAAGRYGVGDHVLAGCHPDLVAAEAALGALDLPARAAEAVAGVPDSWLGESADARRRAFVEYLAARFAAREVWLGALAEDLERGPTASDATRRVSSRSRRPEWLGRGGGDGR